MTDHSELIEIEAIKRLKYKYLRCLDQKLWDELAECFVENATSSYSGGKYSYEGRDAILVGYGLCSNGLEGIVARHTPLVIPRAHDCITVFLGSKEAYAGHHRRCPTCYYYTPGWNRGRRVPGPEKLEALRTELATRFDPDDVEFLIRSERDQWALHDTATYLDLGTDDAESEAAYARKCADWLGWKFERLQGDPTLLRDLLRGRWDADRFQFIEPGEELAHSPDEQVMRVTPVKS